MIKRRPADEELSLVNTQKAHLSWAATDDVAARMTPAWQAKFQTYLDQADPKRELDEAERERRAIALRRADLAKMALESARVRRERKLTELFSDEVA